MSITRPYEQVLLEQAERLLECRALQSETPSLVSLELLEAAASLTGGWRLDEYRSRHPGRYVVDESDALRCGSELLAAIRATPIPPVLALSSLARPDIAHSDRRRDGVYYTDFRLARYVAENLLEPVRPATKVIDPASGTGMLLAAVALTVTERTRSRFVAEQAFAGDLSEDALRGTRLVLASLTDSLDAVDELGAHLRVQDSLLRGVAAWHDVAPKGFDVVVGNPPWEKLKASRHEYLKAAGETRHYGDDTSDDDFLHEAVALQRGKLNTYAAQVLERYPAQGGGEPDLYKAFTALAIELCEGKGQLGLLVPAGLIRSAGTQELRELILSKAASIRITVLENRARFFAIDTRFKFLTLHSTFGESARRGAVELLHASGRRDEIRFTGRAGLGRQALRNVRPDLTVPEVRNPDEWRLFRHMHDAGPSFGAENSWWRPNIVREVDMTRDRKNFSRMPRPDALALFEGRMVHQYRTGAKLYVSGTGRRAEWKPVAAGYSRLQPQFWIAKSALPPSAHHRAEMARVGFCDITGQTNERAMLATLIPRGVACGNKVPTVTFDVPDGQAEDAAYLWLGVVNSLPFDWMLRRIITTTVNYFLLLSMPMPGGLTPTSVPGKLVSNLVRKVLAADCAGAAYDSVAVAEMRAEIDTRVAEAYGLSSADVELLLRDFPLLDRGQPPLAGEVRSTVTADLLLARAHERLGGNERARERHQARLALALGAGASAYVPADFASLTREVVEEASARPS